MYNTKQMHVNVITGNENISEDWNFITMMCDEF